MMSLVLYINCYTDASKNLLSNNMNLDSHLGRKMLGHLKILAVVSCFQISTMYCGMFLLTGNLDTLIRNFGFWLDWKIEDVTWILAKRILTENFYFQISHFGRSLNFEKFIFDCWYLQFWQLNHIWTHENWTCTDTYTYQLLYYPNQ